MYKDRQEAGMLLADRLAEDFGQERLGRMVLVTIPRGGIVVGTALGEKLNIKTEPLVLKKIRAPENDEVVIGAVADGGVVVWDEELCVRLMVGASFRQEVVRLKLEELEVKDAFFRGSRPVLDFSGKEVGIIDDGIASGATMKAAIASVRSFQPKAITVIVPIVSGEVIEEIKSLVEELVYLESPELVLDLRLSYADYHEPSDEEIKLLLK